MPHKTFTGRHGFLFNGNRNAGALGKPKQPYEKPKIKSVKPVNIIYK